MRLQQEQRNIPLISQETESLLLKILHKYQPTYCVEIGSASGYSTSVIGHTIHQRGGQLYSFEIAQPAYHEALYHIQQQSLHHVTLYPFDATQLLLKNFLPGAIGCAFIDAQKSQYLDYLIKIQHAMDSTNIVVIDDVIKFHNKLSSLYSYLAEKQINYEIVDTEPGDGVMIIRDW